MSGIASIILAFVVALFFPVADVSTNRLLLSSATVACFIISSYRVWANEHKKSLALENRIAELIAEHKEQNKPVLQIVEKQLETSLLNQKLTTELENYKIETQRAFNEQESVIDYYKSLQKPKLKLLEENPTVELTRYNHFSFRNKTEYCRIARLGISNIGDATVNGIKVIIKDFSWVENRYDGMVLRPKDDFNVHSNGSFNLPSKDVKYIDIALRKEAEFNYHEARTYLRLVAPDYFNTCIGDNEIIGLKIQVVAPNHPPLEMKVDIYLEKMQLTNQDGEVSYFKRLMCRTSTAEENAPTEIRMYQE